MERLAYSVKESASLLGLSESTIKAEVQTGRLKSKKVGGRRIIPTWALQEYVGYESPQSGQVDTLLEGVINGTR